MTAPGLSSRWFVALSICITGLFSSVHAQQDFSVQLSQGGLTSAGIFDSNGKMVRTLWALENVQRREGERQLGWVG
jgi:hypothetical protein